MCFGIPYIFWYRFHLPFISPSTVLLFALLRPFRRFRDHLLPSHPPHVQFSNIPRASRFSRAFHSLLWTSRFPRLIRLSGARSRTYPSRCPPAPRLSLSLSPFFFCAWGLSLGAWCAPVWFLIPLTRPRRPLDERTLATGTSRPRVARELSSSLPSLSRQQWRLPSNALLAWSSPSLPVSCSGRSAETDAQYPLFREISPWVPIIYIKKKKGRLQPDIITTISAIKKKKKQGEKKEESLILLLLLFILELHLQS